MKYALPTPLCMMAPTRSSSRPGWRAPGCEHRRAALGYPASTCRRATSSAKHAPRARSCERVAFVSDGVHSVVQCHYSVKPDNVMSRIIIECTDSGLRAVIGSVEARAMPKIRATIACLERDRLREDKGSVRFRSPGRNNAGENTYTTTVLHLAPGHSLQRAPTRTCCRLPTNLTASPLGPNLTTSPTRTALIPPFSLSSPLSSFSSFPILHIYTTMDDQTKHMCGRAPSSHKLLTNLS